jgi:hypothetical protein
MPAGGVTSRLMTRSGFSLASASVGRRFCGAGGSGNLGPAGATPNMVLPSARALDWLLGGCGRGGGKATVEDAGGILLPTGATGAGATGAGATGAGATGGANMPNMVFCTDGVVPRMAFPVIGQRPRFASCSSPQWVQMLTGVALGWDFSPIPSSMRQPTPGIAFARQRNARFQSPISLPESK